MKKLAVSSILFSALLSLPITSFAQITLSTVTARAGIIRTQWADDPIYSSHLWSFYPEIQAGGAFIVPYFSWGISWGYWTDGIDNTLPVMDMITFSQSGHIVAARIAFHPQILDNHVPMPITVFAGAAEHFTKSSYVGGTDFVGNRGQNSTEQSTTALVGLAVSYPVVSQFNIEAEALQYLPFGDSWIDKAQKNRRAFKFCLVVTL